MSISILSGSMTTLGSGVFLFGGKLFMFQKFALFICCTTVFSFVTAMFFFGALQHIMGPKNGFGDLKMPQKSAVPEEMQIVEPAVQE